jgi:hypothetical protein
VAYQKRYRTVIPVPPDQADRDLLVWLTRESFDRKAEADALVIVEFADLGQVSAEDIPPKVEKQLGKPATEFVWRAFEGVGARA